MGVSYGEVPRMGRPSGQNEAPKNVVSVYFRSHGVLRQREEEEPIWHHKSQEKTQDVVGERRNANTVSDCLIRLRLSYPIISLGIE